MPNVRGYCTNCVASSLDSPRMPFHPCSKSARTYLAGIYEQFRFIRVSGVQGRCPGVTLRQ
ncbi:unnamed protein product [Ixodes pacificus]